MMTNVGNEMKMIKIELKIELYRKNLRILRNRVKTCDFAAISRFHAILMKSYHDFACFSILPSIWMEEGEQNRKTIL